MEGGKESACACTLGPTAEPAHSSTDTYTLSLSFFLCLILHSLSHQLSPPSLLPPPAADLAWTTSWCRFSVFFLKNIDSVKYFKNYKISGSCNYAFPIILKTKNLKKRNYFEKKMKMAGIEFRRGNAGGGNQLRQPYLKEYINKKEFDLKYFKNVEHIHHFGYYIGNYPSLKKNKILKLCKFFNSLDI